MEVKDTYRYYFKVGMNVRYKGVTKDPERREQEHLLEYPDGYFKIVGCRTTEEAAREWEARGGDDILSQQEKHCTKSEL